MKQIKGNGIDFYCKSELTILKDGAELQKLSFDHEPVGGDYGISKPIELENHLIFTKHGDYDGRTLIINSEGKLFNIIGGETYLDADANLLFTIYGSELNGFAVFDLTTDSLMFEAKEFIHTPISFHKLNHNRYFMMCYNDNPDEFEKSIWEFEFDLDRIMQVEMDSSEFDATNMLLNYPVEYGNCECEN